MCQSKMHGGFVFWDFATTRRVTKNQYSDVAIEIYLKWDLLQDIARKRSCSNLDQDTRLGNLVMLVE